MQAFGNTGAKSSAPTHGAQYTGSQSTSSLLQAFNGPRTQQIQEWGHIADTFQTQSTPVGRKALETTHKRPLMCLPRWLCCILLANRPSRPRIWASSPWSGRDTEAFCSGLCHANQWVPESHCGFIHHPLVNIPLVCIPRCLGLTAVYTGQV
jgi:hypothetical protein